MIHVTMPANTGASLCRCRLRSGLGTISWLTTKDRTRAAIAVAIVAPIRSLARFDSHLPIAAGGAGRHANAGAFD